MKASATCTKTDTQESSSHLMHVARSWGVSFHLMRNSYKPKLTIQKEWRRAQSLPTSISCTNKAEALRLIHQEPHPKTSLIAFNLHGLAYKYICGQNNGIYIRLPCAWWPEQVHGGFALLNSTAGSCPPMSSSWATLCCDVWHISSQAPMFFMI